MRANFTGCVDTLCLGWDAGSMERYDIKQINSALWLADSLGACHCCLVWCLEHGGVVVGGWLWGCERGLWWKSQAWMSTVKPGHNAQQAWGTPAVPRSLEKGNRHGRRGGQMWERLKDKRERGMKTEKEWKNKRKRIKLVTSKIQGRGNGGEASGAGVPSKCWSSWNLLQITAPDAPPFQFHTTQFHSSGANVSLSASVRLLLLPASHLCPSLCLLLLLLHLHSFISLTLSLSPTSLTLSLPSIFNVLFKWLGHCRETEIERCGK